MKRSVRVFIEGAVQGIFFRQFVKDAADRVGVNGFVRNLPDGRVECYFEGGENEVIEIVKICQVGPKHAQIRNIKVTEEKFQDLLGFKILH